MRNKIFLIVFLLICFSLHNVLADDLVCECGVSETIYGDDGSVIRRSNYGEGWINEMTCSRNAGGTVACSDPWGNNWSCSSNTDGTATCSNEQWDSTWSCDSMTDCLGFPYNSEEEVDLADILGFTPSETWQYGYRSQGSSSNSEETNNSQSGGSQNSGSAEPSKKIRKIYTVEEATRVSKPTGNVIKIRYK